MHMRWLGDKPHLDIARGNRASGAKRGLIGIGWKKMRNGTSIHANFNTEQIDSIVMISPQLPDIPRVTLVDRSPMESFEVSLEHNEDVYHLKASAEITSYTPAS
jgi:hypothetical protein